MKKLNVFQRNTIKRLGLAALLVSLFGVSMYLDAQEGKCMEEGHSWGQCTGRG